MSYARDGRLHVEGELAAAGQRAPLVLDASLEQTDAPLAIDAAATVDQRRLGMTWSPLGIARTPTALTVHARLRRALIVMLPDGRGTILDGQSAGDHLGLVQT